ncbi:MAG: glycosyltransferase family 4 protein [Deltaproteobacteria bacterium]|nr:glycosyltransferase family 4 protein [Deltaproteobacteria bacterium]
MKSLKARFARHFERNIAENADVNLVFADVDAKGLPLHNTHSVQNVAYCRPEPQKAVPLPNTHTIGFVDTYHHSFNLMDLKRFLHTVFPIIKKKVPDVCLILAGKGLDETQAQLGLPRRGVEVIGEVDDVSAVYEQAQIVVCPMLSGEGGNVNVSEAICHHRPVVSYSYGVPGQPEDVVMSGLLTVVDNDQAFASRCVELLENPDLVQKLHSLAVDYVELIYPRSYLKESLAKYVNGEVD